MWSAIRIHPRHSRRARHRSEGPGLLHRRLRRRKCRRRSRSRRRPGQRRLLLHRRRRRRRSGCRFRRRLGRLAGPGRLFRLLRRCARHGRSSRAGSHKLPAARVYDLWSSVVTLCRLSDQSPRPCARADLGQLLWCRGPQAPAQTRRSCAYLEPPVGVEPTTYRLRGGAEASLCRGPAILGFGGPREPIRRQLRGGQNPRWSSVPARSERWSSVSGLRLDQCEAGALVQIPSPGRPSRRAGAEGPATAAPTGCGRRVVTFS
ncbi:MAG: hypothetical protein QOI74_693 [Micromonosporaceae bacterium]|nr:hypothetical protein [Micromonosporaceae bacterium]